MYKVETPELLYYGITCDPERRKNEHLKNSSNKFLRDSISRFGYGTFSVLCIGSAEYIYSLEKSIIAHARIDKVNIANISSGGEFSGGMPGEAHWNSQLTDDDIISIRELATTNTVTHRRLAEMYNTGYKNISKIVRGERWTNVGGPITMERQSVSKVANRRKLTDEDVVYIRETCSFIFTRMGKFNIPEFATLYGVSRNSFRGMLNGTYYKALPGPLLGKDYWLDYGR